ncbi:hypothetical protein [Mycobacteroides abscessus]|uniref:hypothetical protein n=1 Tax=Mycobacteroides abscessus TaxID=36809 RepID=UPI00092641B9|nr:hypothetical protein [Mycobacteroides abscessus]SIJ93444.1 Uncharacterised protein [Mycobacteroides abscessus subsp. abscessus]
MSTRIRTAHAVRDWILSPITAVATVIVAVTAGAALWLSPSGQAPAEFAAEGRVEIPVEHRAAASAAAANYTDYRWTEGCHTYVRTLRGAVYWVAPGGSPNVNTWEVGRRGWPTGGCVTAIEPAVEPCDANGVPVCGTNGGDMPGITDGQWTSVPATSR